MEITQDVRKQIVAYAREFIGIEVEATAFHKFVNRPGYMLAIETRNVEGFKRFLEWMDTKIERRDIEVVRTLPEEQSPFADLEQKTLGYFNWVHGDFRIATEVGDGRITSMIKEEDEHAI